MKTPFELFMAPYAAWLDYCRSMLAGGRPAAPAGDSPARAEQDWEHEGGSIGPAKKQPDKKPKPRLKKKR